MLLGGSAVVQSVAPVAAGPALVCACAPPPNNSPTANSAPLSNRLVASHAASRNFNPPARGIAPARWLCVPTGWLNEFTCLPPAATITSFRFLSADTACEDSPFFAANRHHLSRVS